MHASAVFASIRKAVLSPSRTPIGIAAVTWLYALCSLLPVVIAIQFSFNDGRSVSVWQGFTATRWYWGDPVYSVWHDPALQGALLQSLELAFLSMLIATPLGFMLAIGLGRSRGPQASVANFLVMFPLVTPEIVLGVSLHLVFLYLYVAVPAGTLAQLLGHVTLAIPYVVLVVRSRLYSIGRQYEEAAADLGATPFETMRFVLLPLLMPAVLSGSMMVFAVSIDNFVISQWLSCGAGCDTIPVKIYSATRSAPLPSVNALAAILVYLSLAAMLGSHLVSRLMSHSGRARETTAAGGYQSRETGA